MQVKNECIPVCSSKRQRALVCHQREGDDAAQGVDAIYDYAELHERMLYLFFCIDYSREYSAENHEDGVAGNHDFRRGGFQGPGEAAQGQEGPGEEEHQGADGCQDCLFRVIFHIGYHSFLLPAGFMAGIFLYLLCRKSCGGLSFL